MNAPSVRVTDGFPVPLGSTFTKDGCNFAVYAPDALKVNLCLFDSKTEEPIASYVLPAKTGSVWHGCFKDIKEGTLYGLRVEGEFAPEKGLLFNRQKLLLDPYAKQLSRKAVWDQDAYEGDSHTMIPKCVVRDELEKFTWHTRPNIPKNQTILYEAHVKGLTKLHPDVPKKLRGTYLGACHPSVIKHLNSLGITAVQFMPVASFMPEPFITEKGLTNYWGYNPLCFMAPEPRYAIDDPVEEFRTMVRTFHAAGIEVILDVVFNHNAEGGDRDLLLSLKGMNNRASFLFERDEYGNLHYDKYINNSGCGNSLNVSHPYMMQLVMDSLRYWVEVMGADGFRFDLAASLGRDPYDFTTNAGIFRAIRQDPVLSRVKLIAEPWDIGFGGYRLGQFPTLWHEVNDKFRDNVRAFWRGDAGQMSEFATRITGSRDIFHKNKRSILTSVNNITYHDGFTLQDMVSYNERHNLANLEENRDGHGHNLSCNYGHEGETKKTKINQLRERQKRNLFTTLMFSQGIPHILAGDELSRTQQGNNNAYCQDNPISWIDWKLNKRKSDFLDFCRYVIHLRRGSRIASEMLLEDDIYANRPNVENISWYRPDGERKTAVDWESPNVRAFAMQVKGYEGDDEQQTEHHYLCVNASDDDVRFRLPESSAHQGWHLVLDTRYSSLELQPDICVKNVFLQAGKSVAVFRYTS